MAIIRVQRISTTAVICSGPRSEAERLAHALRRIDELQTVEIQALSSSDYATYSVDLGSLLSATLLMLLLPQIDTGAWVIEFPAAETSASTPLNPY